MDYSLLAKNVVPKISDLVLRKFGSVARGLGYARPKPIKGQIKIGHENAIQRRDLPKRAAGPYFLRGYKASDLEWRTYTVLRRLGWQDSEIEYQVDVLGGRMPGGQVLDFVVWAWSGPIVIAVNGDYWHARNLRTRAIEKEKEAFVRTVFGSRMKYLALYNADLLDDQTAYRTLLKEVGRG